MAVRREPRAPATSTAGTAAVAPAATEAIHLLSHQLKSPLHAIQSLLKTALGGYAGDVDPRARHLVEKAVRKSEEAAALVVDLLEFGFHAGGRTRSDEPYDLSALVDSTIARLMAAAGEKSISLTGRLPAGTGVIVAGDARGMDMALRNLVENAIKYTPDGGWVRVRLSVSRKATSCLLTVSDSGEGIPRGDLPRLFEPFFRSAKHRASTAGTGLGLAIARAVARGHGGDLSVRSEEGKGTVFQLALPYRRLVGRSRRKARRRVVIVGGVTAGPKAAARLRRLDEGLDITIVERGEFLSYNGCGLPAFIGGGIRSSKALMSTADHALRDVHFFEAIKDITVLNRTEAVGIDRKRKTLTLAGPGGRRQAMPYDVLVLATGARASTPRIPGLDGPHVHRLRDIDDAEAIRREFTAAGARDVTVIGGGLIGMEATGALVEAGARVTILEREPTVLRNLLDAELAGKLCNELRRKGVKVVTDVTVRGARTSGGLKVVESSAGRFRADFVLVATGVRPESGLGRKAGLRVGPSGGIAVDASLRTSDPSIYAIGDCAETVDAVTGGQAYWPLGSISTKMGRIAADAICGRKTRFDGFLCTAMFEVFGLAVARTGLTAEEAARRGFAAEAVTVAGLDKAHYRADARPMAIRVVADRRTRRLLGAQGIGRGDVAGRIGILATAVGRKLSLDDVFHLDLGYAPSFNTPIDLLQVACLVLQNRLDGLVRTISAVDFERERRGLHVVDVSPPAEHLSGSIPGSINVPLENLRREQVPFGRDEGGVLYSRTSSGAYEAYRHLLAKGFTAMRVLEGGYLYWSM